VKSGERLRERVGFSRQKGNGSIKVAHLTTVDASLHFLVLPQLLAVVAAGGDAVGISAPGPYVPELERSGIRHLALPTSTRAMNIKADAAAAWRLWRILRNERIDILHTHNPKPGLYGRVIGRMAGVPVIINTLHGLYPPPDASRFKRWVGGALEVLAARCSDLELIQNPEDVEFLAGLPGYPRTRSRLLGNGVDLRRFHRERFSPHDCQAIRHELGIRDDHIVVGCVARLVAEKGYPELFTAARTLGERYVVLAIGPKDPEKPDALPEREIEAAQRAGVRFLGMRDDVDRLYAAMDIFVLPSHREGYPRAAMEAAAMALPVVATDIRGCRQVVDDGITGLLVPARRPDALATAIATLGEDRHRRQRMGEQGRQRAEEHFDENRIVDIVMTEYRTQLSSARSLGRRAHRRRGRGDD
jgi:glycosyltransferase involved in cell wall biosynthesis